MDQSKTDPSRARSTLPPAKVCSALKCADTDFSVPDDATFGMGPPSCASRSALPLDGACGPASRSWVSQ